MKRLQICGVFHVLLRPGTILKDIWFSFWVGQVTGNKSWFIWHRFREQLLTFISSHYYFKNYLTNSSRLHPSSLVSSLVPLRLVYTSPYLILRLFPHNWKAFLTLTNLPFCRSIFYEVLVFDFYLVL